MAWIQQEKVKYKARCDKISVNLRQNELIFIADDSNLRDLKVLS